MSGKPDINRLLAEVARRRQTEQNLDWDVLMFGPQRAFIEDESRLKAACCGRRSGKSHGIGLAMLKAGFQYPGSTPMYMNGTRASIKKDVWPALRDINEAQALDLRFIESDGSVKLPNGSTILSFGVGTRKEMDKIRGGKPPIACIDECQNMGSDLAYLVSQVVLPSTADYKASVLLTGTPNASCTGPFHDILHGGALSDTSSALNWSTHHWTMAANPYITDVEEEYDLMCAAMGWTRQSPGFLREMMGLWVRDTQGLAFHISGDMIVDEADLSGADDWEYILGVDLGTKDPCAFTVLVSSKFRKMTYVLESYQDQFTTLTAGSEIERLMATYPIAGPIPADSGGQGQAFVGQWKTTHPYLPVVPVKKGYGSVDMGINILNADARIGKVKIVKKGCAQLIDQMQTLVWDDKESITGVRRIKRGDRYPDHCADSLRYAYTRVRTYDRGKAHDYPALAERTPEWFLKQAQKRKAEVMAEKELAEKPAWQKMTMRPGTSLRTFRKLK